MNRSLESRIARLEKLIKSNNKLKTIESLARKRKKYEGGAAGHMSHIYDYSDFTLNDIKNIINNLFSGEVEDITEKLDGMNIQCTMNNSGNVVFVRNKGDLNSETGGMSAEDMAAKWADRPHVANVYLSAADIIKKVFKKVGKKFFNPNTNTKILANCECTTAGKTNILMYANAQVDFHNLWVYTRDDESSEWVKSDVTKDGIEVLEKACSKIDGAQITPKLVIKVTEQSDALADKYIRNIEAIFKEAGCSNNSTIDDYKKSKFNDLCCAEYEWINSSETGKEVLYNRFFNSDKSVNLRELKKLYKDHLEELDEVTKVGYKYIVATCMHKLDTFFSRLGNSIISMCDGLVNAGMESTVIDALSNDIEEIVAEINANGTAELNNTLANQLNRLADLGNQINATEGIVFKYNDRLIKCTGSFAAINQIIGLRFKM